MLKPQPLATRHLARHLRPASSWALALLKPLGLGYAAICGVAYLAQRRLQYFPSEGLPPPPRATSPVTPRVLMHGGVPQKSPEERELDALLREEARKLRRDRPRPLDHAATRGARLIPWLIHG